MFRILGPVDPLSDFAQDVAERFRKPEIVEKLQEHLKSSAVYLRPETAQAMFVQFLNVLS